MFRRLTCAGTTAIAALLVAGFFPGCSSDDCPTCPEPATSVGLSSEVMLPSPAPFSFQDLWIAGPEDVFVSANRGVVLRMQGSDWTTYNTGAGGDLYAIWGTSATDVYAVGERGLVLHFNGTSWHQLNSTTLSTLMDVHGTAASNVYAVGDYGTIIHYDGATWSTVNTGLHTANRTFRGVWCAPTGGKVFAAGAQWSPSYHGSVIEYDGAGTWTETAVGSQYLKSIWGSAADNVYTHTEDGGIYHYNGSTWSLLYTYPGNVYSLHCDPAGVVRMVGSNYQIQYGRDIGVTYQYDGGPWWTTTQDRYMPVHTAISVRAPDEKYILSRGSVIWADPDDFELSLASNEWLTDNNLSDMWVFAADNLYAVGEYGIVIHYDGTTWETQNSTTRDPLYALWSPDPDRLWAVGANGTILYYNGTFWSEVNHGVGNDPHYAIWGAATDDITSTIKSTYRRRGGRGAAAAGVGGRVQ